MPGLRPGVKMDGNRHPESVATAPDCYSTGARFVAVNAIGSGGYAGCTTNRVGDTTERLARRWSLLL